MDNAVDDCRFLPGAGDRYVICRDGTVLSVFNKMRPMAKHFTSFNDWSRGRVGIYWPNGETRFEYVSELVWIAFNGDIPEGYTVEHINRDQNDDSLDNLRIVTLAENQARITRSRESTKDAENGIEDVPTKMFLKALNMVYYHITKDDILIYGDTLTYASSLQDWTGVMDGENRMIVTSSLRNVRDSEFFKRTLIRSVAKGREKYQFMIEGRSQ